MQKIGVFIKLIVLCSLIVLLFVANSCEEQSKQTDDTETTDEQTSACKEVVKPDCFCPEIYDPVCGCNGKTYSNSCEAECHSIMNYVKGECK